MKVFKTSIVALLLCGLLLAAPASFAQESEELPNIIFLVIDDAGYSDIGPFGSEIPTPTMDTLAENGLMLTDFHTAPSCSPTRAQLLTGQDHHRAGFGNMAENLTSEQIGQPGYEGFLNERVLPISDVLGENGYHTYMAGKWHLGSGENDPYNHGFQETISLIQGFGGHFGNQPGFEGVDQIYTRNGEPFELPEDFYSTEFYTDMMIDFIDSNLDSGQPFFAYMAYTAPHDPIQAPEEWREMFDGMYDEGFEAIHEQRLERMIDLGIVPEDTTVAPYPEEAPEWDELSAEEQEIFANAMETYAAMLAILDSEINRFLAYLEETGELDNTWIFFMSDNGSNGEGQNAYFTEDFLTATYDNTAESIGTEDSFFLYGPGWGYVSATPLRGYKGFPTEGGTRTPAIIVGPDVPLSVRTGMNDAFINVFDFYPTVLDITGIEYPESYDGVELLPLQGKSMLPMLTGEAESIHSEDDAFGWELWGRAALRKGDWKILWLREPEGTGDWALYDLSVDIAETNNLADEEPEILADMITEWEQYAEDNGLIYTFGVLPWEME